MAAHSQFVPSESPAQRIAAIDVFRGLVLLLLVPDTFGGFSFHAVARAHPESELWGHLARWFTHVEWTGFSVWDLVMPAFVFTIGLAMPFSYETRRKRGESETQIWLHALRRSVLLFLLGMNLLLPKQNLFDYLWPLAILTVGLPALTDSPTDRARLSWRYLSHVWLACVIVVSSARIAFAVQALGNYNFAHLLTQVALAYPFAFLLLKQSIRVQLIAACGILIAYWLAFQLYSPPTTGNGVARFAHWEIHSNFAAAFDRWFLNVLPRAAPYTDTAHGYQTITFIPLIVSILIGGWVGRWLQMRYFREVSSRLLLAAGAGAILIGWLLGRYGPPLVKSLWTPSWAIFSSGVVIVVFTAVYLATRRTIVTRALTPLTILGTNSILLYVLADNYRWYLIAPWNQVTKLAPELGQLPWWPVAQSLFCLGSLFLIAAMLYRARIFLRI